MVYIQFGWNAVPVRCVAAGGRASKPVDAQWDKMTLTSDDSCMLIRQVQQQVLPLFATRNQTSGCSQRFSVEVLRPTKASSNAS